MTKKKKLFITVVILSMILTAFISGQVYAKYITEVKGEGIAKIATWDFKVNGQKELVKEINLASTCNNKTLTGNQIAPRN